MKRVRWLIEALLVLAILGYIVSPVSAWGLISHTTLSMNANHLSSYLVEYRSGAIAPDSGWRLSPDWGEKYHGKNVAMANKIGETMLSLASNDKERAFAKGWWAHLSQDRPAHGRNHPPYDSTYNEGYIDYEASQTGQSHQYVEFEVDGRMIYEHGFGGGVSTWTIPVDLVHKTMLKVYGESPGKWRIGNVYRQIAAAYFIESSYWLSQEGLTHYLFLKLTGRHANYDDYVSAVNCNPYEEAIALTNNPYKNAKSKYIGDIATEKVNLASIKDNNRLYIETLSKYAKKAEKIGAIEVKTYYKDGWYTIKIKSKDKSKLNKLIRSMTYEFVQKGLLPKSILHMEKMGCKL